MPITNVFDPYTGAANGGVIPSPGGGGTLYKPTFNEVNLTDGSWTLYDPDSLVQSVSFSGGYNTVTWNALAVASLNYNWAAGGEHRAPRWYKDNSIDGNLVNTIDFNVFTSVLQVDETVDDFNQAVLMGIAQDPAVTDLFYVDASGGYFTKLTGNDPAWGTHQYASATTGTNASVDYSVCTIMRGGQLMGSGVYINADSTDDVGYVQGSRNSNTTVIATATPAPTSVIVGVGVRSNTDTVGAGDQQRFRAQYISYVPDVTGGVP